MPLERTLYQRSRGMSGTQRTEDSYLASMGNTLAIALLRSCYADRAQVPARARVVDGT